MGRLIFSTQDGDSFQRFGRDMRGTTDFMAAGLCLSIIGKFDTEFWAPMFGLPAKPPYQYRPADMEYRFSGIDDRPLSLPNGGTVAGWDVAMNTLKAVASEPIKLLIHIHAQCEIHGWFWAKNAPWVRDGLSELMEVGVLYEDRPLIDWLGKKRGGPIVMSYSVCDIFPSPYLLPELGDHEDPYEAVEDWPAGKLFRRCFEQIGDMELTPERVRKTLFGHGLTLYDMRRIWTESKAEADQRAHETEEA